MTQHADQEIARWTATCGHPQMPNTNHNLAFGGSPEFVIITKEIKALFDYFKPFAISLDVWHSFLKIALPEYRATSTLQCPQQLYALWGPVSPTQVPGLILLPSTHSEPPALGSAFLPVSSQLKACLHNPLETFCLLASCFKNVKRCRQQEWLEVFSLLEVLKFRIKPQYVPREV